jgi:phenylacetate-coenzyme A ligase PaaK-like adenylate-forming protein
MFASFDPFRRSALAFDILNVPLQGEAAVAERQRNRLAELLEAAARGSTHYRRFLRGRDPDQVTLDQLPVLAKPELMQRFADFVTDSEIELPALRGFTADPSRIGEAYLGRYAVWESSGSTGEPGLFVHDERALEVYDTLEALRRHTPRPITRWFDPWMLGERIAFLSALGGHFATHASVQRLRRMNPWLTQGWGSFSVLQPLPELVAQLDRFVPTIIATYPTAAVVLAGQAAAGTLRVPVREIWTGGETLTPSMRAAIEQGFGCPVRNSYGASEFLPIAWECSQGALHVNADWVILEPVDEQHRPVPAGTLSHTTLLTNLANHAQPLIRYDIGDRTAISPDRCACGSPLPVIDVHGRSDDVLVLGGRRGEAVPLLPLALVAVLEEEAGLFDFRLEQHGPHTLQLHVDAAARAAGERAATLLHDHALAHGAAPVRVQVVAGPAPTRGRSGKLQRIVASPGRRH